MIDVKISIGLKNLYQMITTPLSLKKWPYPIPVGIVLITANSTDPTFLIPDGYITLFGLIYALHLDYPKELA